MTLVNVDPNNGPPSMAELKALGLGGVRLVARNDAVVRQYIGDVQANDLMVLAVITEQSGGAWGTADMYQIGNEPDIPSTADSRTPSQYIDYWNLYYNTMRGQGVQQPIMSAGLGSGMPSWWRSVQAAGGLPGCAALCLHPYAKTAAQSLALFASYRAIAPATSIFVDEWNRPHLEIPEYMMMLRSTTYIMGNAWFCWQPYQGFGLSTDEARLMSGMRS